VSSVLSCSLPEASTVVDVGIKNAGRMCAGDVRRTVAEDGLLDAEMVALGDNARAEESEVTMGDDSAESVERRVVWGGELRAEESFRLEIGAAANKPMTPTPIAFVGAAVHKVGTLRWEGNSRGEEGDEEGEEVSASSTNKAAEIALESFTLELDNSPFAALSFLGVDMKDEDTINFCVREGIADAALGASAAGAGAAGAAAFRDSVTRAVVAEAPDSSSFGLRRGKSSDKLWSSLLPFLAFSTRWSYLPSVLAFSTRWSHLKQSLTPS
jgi:hypothetical protein